MSAAFKPNFRRRRSELPKYRTAYRLGSCSIAEFSNDGPVARVVRARLPHFRASLRSRVISVFIATDSRPRSWVIKGGTRARGIIFTQKRLGAAPVAVLVNGASRNHRSKDENDE